MPGLLKYAVSKGPLGVDTLNKVSIQSRPEATSDVRKVDTVFVGKDRYTIGKDVPLQEGMKAYQESYPKENQPLYKYGDVFKKDKTLNKLKQILLNKD